MDRAEVADSPTFNATYQLPRSIPQLDSLRGLAVLMVVASHIVIFIPIPTVIAEVFYQGWIGVDLFFVLSGFLITGILWDAHNSDHYFRRFYGRRILRIWPAYTILLFFAYGVLPLLRLIAGGSFLDIQKESLGLWAFLLMSQNLFPSLLFHSAMMGVTWSLAVEEQFYLIWPVAIRHASRRVALPCLLVFLLLSPLIRICARHYGFAASALFMNPLTHGDGITCGAILAIWLRSAKPKRCTLLLLGIVLLLIGLVLFVPIRPIFVAMEYCSPFVFTAAALFSSGLLLVALVSENAGSFVHGFFVNKTLAFFGFISYSLYLYHFILLRMLTYKTLLLRIDLWQHPLLTLYLMGVCALGFSVLLAWISRVTVERFALSKKAIFD